MFANKTTCFALLFGIAFVSSPGYASDNDAGKPAGFNAKAFGAPATSATARGSSGDTATVDPRTTGGGGFEVASALGGGGGMDVGALRVNTVMAGVVREDPVPAATRRIRNSQ